jgi:hypothetical protein
MKNIAISLLLLISLSTSVAQKISVNDDDFFANKEDSLKYFANRLIQGINAADRFKADSNFTKMFVRALKAKNSFHYPFDSLVTISKLYAPDSSFRIFTWQMVINENIIRQHGAIQMNTKDGTLQLYPLIDKSDVTVNQTDTVGNNLGWMGAVYYKIIETNSNNQNYYTLLGYDENNIRSTKKVIEVLNFSTGEPQFGGRFFSFENDSIRKPTQSRLILEFKKSAGARLHYDEDQNMIIYEHLESESNEPKKKWTLIPDGDYEGFTWKNGKWVHIEKVFTYKTPEGKEPVPMPVRDEKGKINEEKLNSDNQPPEDIQVEKMPGTKSKNSKPIKAVKKKN